MSRRIMIAAALALVVAACLSAVFVSGENTFLTCGKTEAKAGEDIKIEVDLSGISEEEYGEYNLKLTVEPADAAVAIRTDEDVDVTINNTRGICTIRYEALSYFDKLGFTVRTDAGLTDKVSFTVKAEIEGETKTSEESIALTAVPDAEKEDKPEKETKPRKSSSSGSSGGGVVDSGDEGDGENVYRGSGDNYLSSLKIEGYKMEQKFHKTRDTYFVRTGKDVRSLKVSAAASSKSAKVDIMGSDSISGDMSKILINVTAENGDVRVYRIYVMQEGEQGNEKN
ncbi:MAG: hypothetical protein MR991_07005 [Clostridiales bacterium]|nr:hypothetical protein [Clostridiales bacterium]MDY2920428.1 hypothetical protein [Lentihominibacter sp.]